MSEPSSDVPGSGEPAVPPPPQEPSQQLPPRVNIQPPPLRTPPPPPPPTRNKGCLFWGFTGAAILFFVTTVLLFLALSALLTVRDGGMVSGSGRQFEQEFIEETVDGVGEQKVLLVSVNGVIMEGDSDLLPRAGEIVSTTRRILAAARLQPDIKAILLSVNSPGGGITASDVLYHEILKFRKETGKPVITLFGDVAASGGYYVAAASQHIVAHPTTITGSIGVLLPLIGVEDLMGKIGIESRPIKSGELKDIMSVMREMKPAEAALLQEIVTEYHNRFVTIVHDGMQARGVKMTREELETLCDGRVFTATQALDKRFIDEIGYFDDAVNAVCKWTNLPRNKVRVVTYTRRRGLLGSLLAHSAPMQPQAITLNMNGLVPTRSPQFMYLWSVGGAGNDYSGRN